MCFFLLSILEMIDMLLRSKEELKMRTVLQTISVPYIIFLICLCGAHRQVESAEPQSAFVLSSALPLTKQMYKC